MRWRKIALCTVVFFMMGSSYLFADAVNQKIKVWSNGKEIADGGYLIDGKTYIPAREAGGRQLGRLGQSDNPQAECSYRTVQRRHGIRQCQHRQAEDEDSNAGGQPEGQHRCREGGNH